MASFLKKNEKEGREMEKTLWDKKPGKILQTIDVCAKLVAAGAIVAATIVGAKFESSVSKLSLQNQREQADSEVRASMFRSLIGPIIGSTENNIPLPDRERLLAELLTLNFHNHFELKPLLRDVDKRLRDLQSSPDDKFNRERRFLRSAARRVIDRQINRLRYAEKEIRKVEADIKQGVKEVDFFFKLGSSEKNDEEEQDDKNKNYDCNLGRCFSNPAIVKDMNN